ncbi:hypothetical protein ABT024_13840 [Streptomyces sp. NPDC002812]|uniref:hypothetical protein n=1 Tax=unclassified Streptomyces TaxID=2593676 RepID=UPI0020304FE4|nr:MULTISPECIES: hypothetical protein [unclassified Streptomyces]MCM1965364.1 hypothetical protein [Streptomyces sp. G1]MCX5128046.1 hypothetical protein [Streptomyces sp. NBC_00347]MCX5301062.1 hypothetical protein [Streptomyces sp. NBC_00193]
MTAPPADTRPTPGGAAFAPAFRDDADVRAVDAGSPALDAYVASGADGGVHVLTVRNGTDQDQELFPEALLPDGDDPLFFLGGASTTEERDGRLVARLAPHGHVHLGRITR